MSSKDNPFRIEPALRWWAPGPTYREDQDAFESTWKPADFASSRCVGIGVLASPDGSLIGYQFERADGSVFRMVVDPGSALYAVAGLTMRALEESELRRRPAMGTA